MTQSIKFKHTITGEIAVNQGVTPLCDLLNLGALISTAKPGITDKRMPISDYPTNIGVLLACHGGVLFDDQVTDIAELISGLSELARLISEEQIEINHAHLIGKAEGQS